MNEWLQQVDRHKAFFVIYSSFLVGLGLGLAMLTCQAHIHDEAFHPLHEYPGHLGIDLFDYDAENDNAGKDQKEDGSTQSPSIPESPMDDASPSTIEV